LVERLEIPVEILHPEVFDSGYRDRGCTPAQHGKNI
jgi:hypothetical protein